MKLDLCTEVTLIGENATYIFVFENKVREGKPQICHIPINERAQLCNRKRNNYQI